MHRKRGYQCFCQQMFDADVRAKTRPPRCERHVSVKGVRAEPGQLPEQIAAAGSDRGLSSLGCCLQLCHHQGLAFHCASANVSGSFAAPSHHTSQALLSNPVERSHWVKAAAVTTLFPESCTDWKWPMGSFLSLNVKIHTLVRIKNKNLSSLRFLTLQMIFLIF